MNKNEYLKLAILEKKFYKKSWLISIIALLKPADKPIDELKHLDIIPETWGYSFWNVVDDVGTKVKIENTDIKQPLFNVKDRVNIDSTWFRNVSEPIDTILGNVLFNAICIETAFGNKYPFIKGVVSTDDIAARVAPILQDTPVDQSKKDPSVIYCDEWIKFQDSKEHFKSIAHLLNQSATVKTITKEPGFDTFKRNLEKEYGDRLTNPVTLVEFEKKLQDRDNEWLKGDPADKTFLQGKVRNVARKKMHLSIGSEPGFETKSTVIPITKALDEGWPTDPQEHVSVMNGIRFGSLSRGKETIKGGVTAKHLLRAGNNFSVTSEDCGTRKGLNVSYDNVSIKRLAGRYIIGPAGEAVHIANNEVAEKYMNKTISLRSPAYCRSTGDSICRFCSGDGLALNPKGVAIGLTEMSSIVMNDFMKAMHDTTIKTIRLNIEEIFS